MSITTTTIQPLCSGTKTDLAPAPHTHTASAYQFAHNCCLQTGQSHMQRTASGAFRPQFKLPDAVDHALVCRGHTCRLLRVVAAGGVFAHIRCCKLDAYELGARAHLVESRCDHVDAVVLDRLAGHHGDRLEDLARSGHADAVARGCLETMPADHDPLEVRQRGRQVHLPKDDLATVVACRPPARLVCEAIDGVARYEHRVEQHVGFVVVVAARVRGLTHRGVELHTGEVHHRFRNLSTPGGEFDEESQEDDRQFLVAVAALLRGKRSMTRFAHVGLFILPIGSDFRGGEETRVDCGIGFPQRLAQTSNARASACSCRAEIRAAEERSMSSDAYGGTAANATAELHLKMSKKIAQLTKVIFHLNTRNEDFQMEFAHNKKVHAQELQQLTQDAASKLRMLQEQLQVQTNAAAQWERACAKEKQQFQKEFALYQQKAQAKQTASEESFQQKIAQLEDQVERCQKAFTERIQQLLHMADSQQQQASSSAFATTAALKSAHERELEELREKKNDEVTQLVMASNAKYNQMLADQLRLQDALKDEHAKTKALLEQQLTALQGDSSSRLAAQERAAKDSFDQMKHQFVSKMENLLADTELLRGQETKLRQEKEALLQSQSELQRQSKTLELQVTKAQQEAQSVRKDADANAQNLQQLLSVGTEKIDQLAQELDVLKKTLQTRDHALRQAQKDLEAAQLETLQRNMNLSEKDAAFNQQIREKELQLATSRSDVQALTQQKAILEANLQKKIQGLEAQVAGKEKEMSALQSKLANSELQRRQSQEENEKLLQEMKLESEANDRKVAALVQTHQNALQELVSSHGKALDQQQKALEGKFRDLETQMEQHTNDSLEQTVSKLKQEHSAAMSDQKSEFDAVHSKLTLELAQVRAQLEARQAESTQNGKELADLRAKVTDLTTQLKKAQGQVTALQSDKDAQQKGAEKARKEKEDAFQKQIKELTTQKDSAVKKVVAEKDQMQLQHAQTLMALAKEHKAKLKTLQEEWEAQKQAQLASETSQLTDHYEVQLSARNGELGSLRLQLEKAIRDARETQRSMDETRLYEQERDRSAFVRHLAHLEAQQQQTEDEMRQRMDAAVQRHAEELEALRQRLNAEKQTLLSKVEENAELRLVQVKAGHRDELETKSQQHALATKELQELLETKHRCEVLAMRTENTQKMRDVTAQKDRERVEALQEAQGKHDTAFGTLQKQAELLQSALTQKTIDFNSRSRENERLSAALDAKTKEMTEKVASLERTNRDHIETLKKAAKQDMDRLLEENLAETKLLSDQFEETKRLMTDKVVFLKQTITEWEDRYARRESRPEDVSRIADLERLVVEKEALVRQTLDEMAYFKRELLNREEMYNKTFARTPNVGVMNVLKPHVQLQQQMQMQGSNSNSAGINVAPQMKRKVKPSTSGAGSAVYGNGPELQSGGELHRRNSERGSSGGSSDAPVKKSLPPLNSNQFAL